MGGRAGPRAVPAPGGGGGATGGARFPSARAAGPRARARAPTVPPSPPRPPFVRTHPGHALFRHPLSPSRSCMAPPPFGPLPLRGLQHVSLCVRDADASIAFWRDVLGFQEVRRPKAFTFEGSWSVGGAVGGMGGGRERRAGCGRRHGGVRSRGRPRKPASASPRPPHTCATSWARPDRGSEPPRTDPCTPSPFPQALRLRPRRAPHPGHARGAAGRYGQPGGPPVVPGAREEGGRNGGHRPRVPTARAGAL